MPDEYGFDDTPLTIEDVECDAVEENERLGEALTQARAEIERLRAEKDEHDEAFALMVTSSNHWHARYRALKAAGVKLAGEWEHESLEGTAYAAQLRKAMGE